MKRQVIYAGAIVTLAIVQMLPCVLLLGSTIIAAVLGTFWFLLLLYFWSSTKIGRWFFVEWYRSTLRLEKFLLGGGAES